MAKKTYIGVNGVAKNVKNVYIGINGVAKKVTKMYIGVNGVAKECYSSIKTVSWTSGSDEDIVEMVQASDAGSISLADYWSINDERTVSLPAMQGLNSAESYSAQDIILVLMDTNKFDLVTATSGGKTKCEFAVGVKNALMSYGYMNSPASNTGSWDGSARRTWCNGTFYNAIPSTLRPIFKQFKTPTINEYNGSTIVYSSDYFALWAEKEIFGSRSYSNATEANALSQIEYYKTTSNRIKYYGNYSSETSWWQRSPYYNANNRFCVVSAGGLADGGNASYGKGISPFGCI